MKALKHILIATFALSALASNAQTKNLKIETVKISGSCGMCETNIEKAGSMKKQSSVDWNGETQLATITYDTLKTSKSEILKRIALVGYDNELFLAPNDTYDALPNCCQYRKTAEKPEENGEVHMEMENDHHSIDSNEAINTKEGNQLDEVFANYFSLKDALVKTDAKMASLSAKSLISSINTIKMEELSMDVHMAWMKVLQELKTDTEQIAKTEDVDKQRKYFSTLSKNMYDMMKISKHEEPIYYQFCPMANDGKGANWLSKEESVKNPYYGSKMLNCGKTVETLK